MTSKNIGDIVVIGVESYGTLKVGLVRNIISCGKEAYLICDSFKASLERNGSYTTSERGDQATLNIDDLVDHHPLRRLGSLEKFDFLLHHYVSDLSV